YWDTQTSGQATSAGGTGKTTVQMMTLSTFTDASWDISQGDDLNNGYPYLGWQASNNSYAWLTPGTNLFAGGDGSSENPYQINSWIGLDAIRDDLDANYLLVDNLSSSSANYLILGNNWTPIGDAPDQFTGDFNGNGKTISDLIINKPEVDYVGLFGYASGNISNIGLINASVTGRANVGCLVGLISGTITNSYSSGTVVGSGTLGHGSNVGVLVGLSQLGEITKSYSTGSVSGSGEYVYSVGGLVGRQTLGTTTNSYSTANVTGPVGLTGGLVGYSSFGIISKSYSVGSVTYVGENNSFGIGGGLVGYSSSETITNSFWDTQTSGETLSDGGTGKTTLKMKGLYTYNLNGGNWDISGGAPDLNNGYPYLTGSTSPIWLIPSTVAIDPTLHRRPTHSECDLQGQCVSVSGSGSNQCTLDMDCLLSATTTATTTPIVCSLGNDCGVSNYTDMPFCQDNNVYQNYTNYLCNNPSTITSFCSSTTLAQIKTTCSSNQTCISGSCVNKIIRRKQLEEVVCGDNTCSQIESCNSCPSDCGECSITDLITGSKNVSDLKPVGNEIVETDIKTGIGQDQASNNIVESVISNIVKSFTAESIKGNIETVTKNVDKIVNSYAGEVVPKTVSTGGAVTAIAITACI
ncbi:MAG: hypothetical protein NTU76_02865, partial [Candidatus Taylorbacteria bacterium]|nr:hypothetical protein [Candidatus Taylorbacteria bacterium]